MLQDGRMQRLRKYMSEKVSGVGNLSLRLFPRVQSRSSRHKRIQGKGGLNLIYYIITVLQFQGGHVVSNKNYLPVNVTTIINITNTIKNENVFHNPIIVNTTNYNNYSSHGTKYHRKHVIINASKKNVTRVNCCEVVHPEVCYKQNQENVCYTKKHSECSQLCVGHHVHIIEDKEQKRQCITLKISPNLLCGNYIVESKS